MKSIGNSPVGFWRRILASFQRGQNLGPLTALAVLVLLLSLASSSFLTVRNVFNVLLQSSINLTMALGMTAVIISGGIDLSVGSVMALTGSITALAGTSWGLPPLAAIAAGIAVGIAVGCLNGFVISRTGIPDFIMTLGVLSSARGLALILTNGRPVTGLPPALVFLGSYRILDLVPMAVVVAAAMSILMWFVLNYTKLGRCAFAIGGNRSAAQAAGISIALNKVLIYALNGFAVGVAGLLQIGRIHSANALMGAGVELQVIAIVIVGGTNLFGGQGTIGGTVIGALILGVISNGLNLLGVSSFFQQLFIGVLIVLVVVLDQIKRGRNVR